MKIFVNVEWLLTEIERVSPQIEMKCSLRIPFVSGDSRLVNER